MTNNLCHYNILFCDFIKASPFLVTYWNVTTWVKFITTSKTILDIKEQMYTNESKMG